MKIKGQIVDIIGQKIFPGQIEIQDKRIKSIEVLRQAPARYILPGFIDSHVHIESSMVLPSRFAETAVSHGTVAVVSDPHEIANVTGKQGVYYMIEDGVRVPFHFYFGAPSCVPATPFDFAGAVIGPDEVNELLSRKDIYFLSEMMNFPGVINGQEDVLQKLNFAKEKNKPVDGHAPGLSGQGLKKYLNAGISTDHESFSLEEAREKIRGGMTIQIREGSAALNFEALHPLIGEFPEKVMFCTDDCHPNDFLKGHINRIVKKALQKGYKLFDVLRAASLNPQRHYRLDTGMLQEGDSADFIVVHDLEGLEIMETWIQGKPVFMDNKYQWERPVAYPINNFKHRKITAKEIEVVPENSSKKIKVIQALDNEIITKSFTAKARILNGVAESNPGEDILKIVVVNRYSKKNPSVGFVKGFGLKTGAIGGSIAHDSHNFIAVGTNDHDIVKVFHVLMQTGGGIVAINEGTIKSLPLPVAGLMSTESVITVAKEYEELDKMAHDMGCRLRAPFMTMAFMSLLVIPELKIGDEGLFDVGKFAYTSMFVD
jgi:adenine deaminase